VAEKARLRRKDIKQPDEFVTLSTQALSWARAHQQLVIWGGAGLVVILVAVGIITAYSGARTRDANADLARALTALGAKDYATASTDLIDLAGRWDGTTVAPLAGLLGANAAIDAGDADKALAELTRLQANAARLPPYLQQEVLLAWGNALETKQQWLDAAAKYKEAAAVSGPYTGNAIVGEARTRERGGDADRARELYRQAYDQFPDLPERDLIAAKVQL
jgi:predicted negative regulator of RcsB-dependent stress response